ncbi:glycoside hydrolase family 3 C-terminal domain-containing protein [Agromyces sp. LHK192]|uniref:glycoside hydrolase family 3 C-terminal domain-containing protein n=1 Tax=Agromyces sp. LHK192 TaxID=2498704 RepID=UPI00196AE7E7|nr:glycoside hydrolase family 3 C-terminal domain-containing protein [Agromyces sp. LHK192]
MDSNTQRPRRAMHRLAAAVTAGALAAAGLVAAATAPATAADCSTYPWMDTSSTSQERAEALLAASSQHQKYRWLVEQPANSPARTDWNPAFPGEDPVVYPAQVPCTPEVIYANGPDGVYGKAGTTAWPGPIAVAATWNLAAGEEKAAAHGSESFDSRSAVVLGPGIASGRTPLSGRGSEYFGEDPLLSGLMAAANVRGLEQGNPDKPVVANLKHYVANEQETDREESSSNMDERTLRQVYDLPYEIAVKESDPGSLMCSYNQVNGVYACENPILTTSLDQQMGFDGYVMSDFGSVHSTAASMDAGLDQELNRPVYYTPARLDAALAAGEITQEQVEQAAYDVVHTYIEKGLFDHLVPATAIPNVSTPEHKALARELAEQSTVLLKNDGALPLADDVPTVAVIGQTASATPTAGVSAKTGCAWYLVFIRGTALNCDAIADPLTAITARVAEAGGSVVYDNGADPAQAASVAAGADVAIVFGHYTMGETTDLADLHLDANGDALIAAVAEASDRTVAVLNAGSAVEMPWIDEVDAVLHAWHSGEQFGPALAALLWGDVNPSGKLPMTFPKSLADVPTNTPEQYPGVFADGSTTRPAGSTEIRQVNYTEGLEVGYKWYDEQGIDPLFEFGYGLSYTSFEYADLSVATTTDAATGAVSTTVSFTVTNTGERDGSEIPQVYLDLPDAADEPGKRLVGFDRIDLAAGESRTVEVVVDSSASNQPYSIWDVDADAWTIVDGSYGVAVGASSRDLRLEGEIVVDRAGQAPVVTTALDPAAPTGSNGWYTDPVALTATATDDVDPAPLVEANVDGAGWAAVVEPIVLGDGAHTVLVRATDAGGNVSAETTVAVNVDTTAPTVERTVDGRWIKRLALAAADATSGVDAIEYRYVLKVGSRTYPGPWTEYRQPLVVGIGLVVKVEYRATDVAGNVSPSGIYRG